MELTLGEETITTFRQALERVSAIAHAKLPADLHGNLERATALVIHRHVWIGRGRTPRAGAVVRRRHVVPRERRVHLHGRHARPARPVQASAGGGPVPPRQRAPRVVHVRRQRHAGGAAALPEAPASVNVRLCIGGADVQWTLRDADEDRLAERLERLLARFPQAAKAPKGEAAQPSTAQTPQSRADLSRAWTDEGEQQGSWNLVL